METKFKQIISNLFTTQVDFDIEEDSSGGKQQTFSRKFEQALKDNNPSIDLLRNCVKSLNKFSTKNDINKSMSLNNYITKASLVIVQEERRRPLEEQFPFVRYDIDALVSATSNLASYQTNKSEELERLIVKGFIQWLKEKNYVDAVQHSINGGKIIDKSGNSVVQWDGIIEAYDENNVLNLFMFEVKDTPHENDILKDATSDKEKARKSLQSRAERMMDVMNSLKVISNETMENQRGQFGIQNRVLHKIAKANSKFIFVYASRIFRPNIKESIQSLQKNSPKNVSYWCCELINWSLTVHND